MIADDSGIESFDLDGAPGIYSARYAGAGASDEDNLDKLLGEVDAADGERRAAYVCVLALVEEDGTEHVFEANCEGTLLRERRGSGGFGYDPVFVPDDTGPERPADDVRALPGGEERDQPPRPRRPPPRRAPRRLAPAFRCSL